MRAAKTHQLDNAGINNAVVVKAAHGDILSLTNPAAIDPADGDASDIRIRIDIGNKKLKRHPVYLRAGNIFDDRVQKRTEIRIGIRCVILDIPERMPVLPDENTVG